MRWEAGLPESLTAPIFRTTSVDGSSVARLSPPESAMLRLSLAVATLALATLCASGAPEARVRFPEGLACHGVRGPSLPVTYISGVYLGGRDVGSHFGNSRDTRFFQDCFRTAELCQRWLAGISTQFPLTPVVARCTPVELGSRTPGVPLEWPSPVRWW